MVESLQNKCQKSLEMAMLWCINRRRGVLGSLNRFGSEGHVVRAEEISEEVEKWSSGRARTGRCRSVFVGGGYGKRIGQI